MDNKVLQLVLLVEDNPADANLVEEAFAEERIDSNLHIVRDGAKAVEFLEKVDRDDAVQSPDLVILDLNLPLVSGEEVLKHVRASRRCRDTKVLIISSSDLASERERVMRLGATGYFRKPSSLDQFMQLGPTVRRLLQ